MLTLNAFILFLDRVVLHPVTLTCLSLGLFHTLGYILLLLLLKRIRGQPPQKYQVGAENLPRVSIVIPTYNEERNIERKVANILSFDYPRHLIEVIFVDDGSQDDTVAAIKRSIKEHPDCTIRLIEQLRRSGPAGACWAGSQEAAGELILWSDADAFHDREALSTAVSYFEDPAVGAVSAITRATPETETASIRGPEVAAKNYLQSLESAVDSTMYVTGTFLLFRSRFIELIVKNAILVDGALAISIRRQGYKVLADPRIASYHGEPTSFRQQLRRKQRNIIGQLQHLMREYEVLFNPGLGIYGWVIAPRDLLLCCLQPLVSLAFWVNVVVQTAVNGLLLVLLGLLFLGTACYFALRLALPRSKVYRVVNNALIYGVGDLLNVRSYAAYIYAAASKKGLAFTPGK